MVIFGGVSRQIQNLINKQNPINSESKHPISTGLFVQEVFPFCMSIILCAQLSTLQITQGPFFYGLPYLTGKILAQLDESRFKICYCPCHKVMGDETMVRSTTNMIALFRGESVVTSSD